MKYIFLLFVAVGQLTAQQKVAWDTTRYQKFKRNLIIGVFQSYHNYNTTFSRSGDPDSLIESRLSYTAESKLYVGLSFTYDKFSLGLSLISKPQKNSEGKGNSTTFVASFNAGGNRWFMENSFRYFSGFYESNSPTYDSTYKETGQYLFQPGLISVLARSKYMYFTNHDRYSFRANTSCNYRQLRTAATWVFSANTNFNYLHNDSSFFPLPTRPYYGSDGTMNGFSSLGLSVHAGAAFTLVLWRAFFFSMMFTFGPEHQWREYQYPDRKVNLSYLALSSDFRTAIGLNFKRFYFNQYTSTDLSRYKSSFMLIITRSISGGFTIGWRFNSHVPAFYKKIQATKLYLAL